MNPHPRPDCAPDCFGCKVRTVQLAPAPAFQPHYNYAVGKHVSTDREFRDELKRSAERNSIATGLDHDYEPRYPGDLPVPPFSKHDGVFDTRARNLEALGVSSA